MKIAEIWDRFLFLVSVPKCVHCKVPLDYGVPALCPACLDEYKAEKMRECSRCHKVLIECSCSNSYLESKGIKHLCKCFRYKAKRDDLRGNSLIYSLKHDYRRDTVDFLADEMVRAAKNSTHITGHPERTVITFVPR